MNATPFTKILVANRGEIALRIMRSAHALGFRTVAVYSSADRLARHVRFADQAVCIGEALPSQSYLSIEAIIQAARLSGADAVHPGYGFLAENEAFAEACQKAGLVFIGPRASAIRQMGDKAGAKRLMLQAGVPCIPGYEGEDQSEERLTAEARKLGYPLMIKATAGGGGRGMRLVTSHSEFVASLHSAQSEAQNAFGSAAVILEKAIANPRHIEIQVFGDRQGNVVHLGERDCSIQRRHQKLIEEAPSPAVHAALRDRMGATAVAAARAIDYEGAGTLEFLLDADGQFYFMEMNTRLQVEHPVTEAITGLDLVEWQLRVAAGEPLPLKQEDIRLHGHAIEVRLCAEDPSADFLPQSGTMLRWQVPDSLRVEHAMASGDEVPPYYDSMIAKLIAFGTSREEARRKLLRGLQDTVALGVPTNQALLARCLSHAAFAAGDATTSFIGQHAADLHCAPEGTARALAVASWLLYMTGLPASRGAHPVPPHPLSHSLPSSLKLDFDGTQRLVNIAADPGQGFVVTIDGQTHSLKPLGSAPCADASFVLDGLLERASFERDGARLWLHYAGNTHTVHDLSRAPSAGTGEQAGSASGDGRVRAAMNGRVLDVLVEVGERVSLGQALVILEAMKMQHVHAASASGTVQALHVSAGDQVQSRHILAEIAPLASP